MPHTSQSELSLPDLQVRSDVRRTDHLVSSLANARHKAERTQKAGRVKELGFLEAATEGSSQRGSAKVVFLLCFNILVDFSAGLGV